MISQKRVKELIKEELVNFYGNDLDANDDGDIDFNEFVSKFDSNMDGVVSPQEFQNQLLAICSNKHIVKPLLGRREVSHKSVPCRNTYDKTSKHLAHNIDNVYAKSYEDINAECGAECPVSVLTAFLDVISSLEDMTRE